MERNTRKKTSRIWNHFQEIERTDENTLRRAKCLHCLQSISVHNCNVGNLNRHMKRKHPAIWTFQYENPYREDSLSSLDKSTCDDDDGKQDNDKYENVDVASCEDNVANESSEEYEYLERTPPKKKKKEYSPKDIKHKYNRNSNYREPQRDHSDIDEARSVAFGRLVSVKMYSLDKNQRLLAEKLINDTLHEAELGNLNKFCCLSVAQMIHENVEPATNVTVTTNADTT